MLSYQVKRTATINKNLDTVKQHLTNFQLWPEWSPWLMMDPDCQFEYKGETHQVGHGYYWSGDLVGAGKMFLLDDSDSLKMSLEFFKPFKSRASVSFILKPFEQKTHVTWVMDAKVPWFLLPFKSFIKNMITLDYERGLKMLKAKLEQGQIHSQLNIIGIKKANSINAIGLRSKCHMNEMPQYMGANIEQLEKYLNKINITPTGKTFNYYLSFDMAKQEFDFYTCIPVMQTSFGKPFEKITIGAGKRFIVEHTGDYQFLGNAWASAHQHCHHHSIKVKRKPLGIETYLNCPRETSPEQLKSQVSLFCK
ncbi:SRPBCC family protein [Paraferrimonas sp. SM1919]|uniref:SRPBCC family protein n=1 Tax=Paraferrimonas sp. SM1919 TaxID=2662263 RepID=UPI0013D23837|nr:SRPBCC family protein [Paraferrimonas sp. SM1919]